MIDIIIPAYNAHETIDQTLYSINTQINKELFKVYIVNDASNQNYSNFVDKYSNSLDIEEITIEKNSGPGVARNIRIRIFI